MYIAKQRLMFKKYKGEKNGQVSAIPYGIPSSFISGIIAGDSLLQDNDYMEMIREMFPNCYILNREGRIFFSPDLTPEQNKENQLECLKSIPEQEGWRKDNIKKTIQGLLSRAIEIVKTKEAEIPVIIGDDQDEKRVGGDFSSTLRSGVKTTEEIAVEIGTDDDNQVKRKVVEPYNKSAI